MRPTCRLPAPPITYQHQNGSLKQTFKSAGVCILKAWHSQYQNTGIWNVESAGMGDPEGARIVNVESTATVDNMCAFGEVS